MVIVMADDEIDVVFSFYSIKKISISKGSFEGLSLIMKEIR